MPNPSPLCEIRDGAGAYQASAGGVNVTPGNTITIRLSSQADVDSWLIECATTDETSVASTVTAALSIDSTNKTATFTAPAPGKAYRFRSRVNQGIDRNGIARPTYETTFTVYTVFNGRRVMASDETIEGSTTFGWITWHNDLIRSAPSGVASGTWGSGGAGVTGPQGPTGAQGATGPAGAPGGGGGGGITLFGANNHFLSYQGGSAVGASGMNHVPTTGTVEINRGLNVLGTAIATLANAMLVSGTGATGFRMVAPFMLGAVVSGVATLGSAMIGGGTAATGLNLVHPVMRGAQITGVASMTTARVGESVSIGAAPATTGALRLADGDSIKVNHGGDVEILNYASGDLTLGSTAAANGLTKIQAASAGSIQIWVGSNPQLEIDTGSMDVLTSDIESTADTYHRPWSRVRSHLSTNANATGMYYWAIKDEAVTSVFAEVNAVASGGVAGGSYARRRRIWANGGVATAGAIEETWNDEVTNAGFTGISVGSGIIIGHSGMTGFINVKGTPTGQIRFGATITHTETIW